jgi:membrane protein insertase Oxa1/YidC/SpoIIIJ
MVFMFLVLLFNIPPLNYVYQFFFNLLILFYEALGKIIENPDMGIAVICLSLFVRILLLPLALSSRSSEEEKERIGRQYAEIKRKHKTSDPLRFKKEKELLIRSENRTIRAEMVNLGIQVLIALILLRVFATGLKGEDMHLLYSWVPQPQMPLNLVFMDTIDLTTPSLQLNILTSVLLFVVEILQVLFSPWEPTRTDRLMQIIVPVGVFIYLYTMPSGKKLFIITSLTFSIALMLLLEAWELMKLSRKKAG